MPTLHSYEELDPEKSISLLTHLAGASKRIFEKEKARRHVEEHIRQLKKVSTKGIKAGSPGGGVSGRTSCTVSPVSLSVPV